ncbi:hypothetical protein [Mobiluncus mulieris]|uniref:hypothetical protein n=1 Tax=Mobiluncus mulieris TaxID=2052 RepID=UPI00146FEE6A|nr:hypothetical protein [Mobiluncus mulieris]MCU9973016.1 hypothetical protein [Mobiluncus mulieris]MCV0010096.1 hypothetical protein [Mobiluncus mulieris]NMW74823.1 hypothetical protein [Mobiluncus mulieris]
MNPIPTGSNTADPRKSSAHGIWGATRRQYQQQPGTTLPEPKNPVVAGVNETPNVPAAPENSPQATAASWASPLLIAAGGAGMRLAIRKTAKS